VPGLLALRCIRSAVGPASPRFCIPVARILRIRTKVSTGIQSDAAGIAPAFVDRIRIRLTEEARRTSPGMRTRLPGSATTRSRAPCRREARGGASRRRETKRPSQGGPLKTWLRGLDETRFKKRFTATPRAAAHPRQRRLSAASPGPTRGALDDDVGTERASPLGTESSRHGLVVENGHARLKPNPCCGSGSASRKHQRPVTCDQPAEGPTPARMRRWRWVAREAAATQWPSRCCRNRRRTNSTSRLPQPAPDSGSSNRCL
jgi:hypothetical protein